MVDYPAGMPDVPLVDSWSMSDVYADPIETDMEGNNKRSRARAGRKMSLIQFDIMYTYAQYSGTMLGFWMNTLGGQATRYNMRVWDGHAMVGPKVVQFAAKPTPTTITPGKVRVTYRLWVYNLA